MFKINRTYQLTTGVKSKGLAVVANENSVLVLQHNTIVFYATPKQVKLNDGGFDTVSTRITINQALREYGTDIYLGRDKGKTYLYAGKAKELFNGSRTLRVSAGMVLL